MRFRRMCSLSRLQNSVARNDLAIPLGGKLGGTLECFEIDIVNAEAFAVAIGPLKIVEQAPQEVALDGVVFLGGPVKVGDMAAQIHHAICIFNAPFGSNNIVGGTAVLADVDRRRMPELAYIADGPVDALGIDVDPWRGHVRIGSLARLHHILAFD